MAAEKGMMIVVVVVDIWKVNEGRNEREGWRWLHIP